MNVFVGDDAPPFALKDQDGKDWSLDEKRGKAVVLYFYPMDDTPGCTKQACDVRDNWAEFARRGVEVVGISPDAVESHAAFRAKYDLPHTLLADTDRSVIDRYGVWGRIEKYGKVWDGVRRSSVVIDADGKVAAAFERIAPEEQSAKALEVLDRLGVKG